MAQQTLTIALGSGEAGKRNRDLIRKAAEKSGDTEGAFCRTAILAAAIKATEKKEK